MKHFRISAAVCAAFAIMLPGGRAEAAALTWDGNLNSNWDTATANWQNAGVASLFANGDAVSFTDTASNFVVNLPISVTPGGVTVSNSFDYLFTGPGAIAGTNSLLKAGTARATILNADTYAGGTTISSGTLQLGNGGGNGSIVGAVVNQGSLVFNRTNAVTFSGVISGSGSVTKLASGALTLTAVSTYSGSTFVNAGSMRVNGALNGGGTVSVLAGATLNGTGTILGAVTIQAGAVLAPNNPAGASGGLTISNSLSLAGSTILRLNKTAGTNEKVSGLSYVTYGGILTVPNLAGTLAAGDSFQLFDAAAYHGAFAAIQPTVPGPGLAWDTSLLLVNGTLRVAAGSTFTISLPTGLSLLCNQLDHGSNRATEIFPNDGSRDGDEILTYNCSNGTYNVFYFDSTSPSGIDDQNFVPVPAPILSPGNGFFYHNNNASNSITFTGQPHVPVLPITNINLCGLGTYYLLGRQINDIGTYENVTGFAPAPGSQVQTWNGSGFVVNTFVNGAWTLGAPALPVGHAAKIFIPACLTLSCGTNKSVACSSAWNFDGPTNIVDCCTNHFLSFTTVTNGLCPMLITRTWVVTNACGQSNSCSQTVTVNNNTPPTINCYNFSVACGDIWSNTPPPVSGCCPNISVTLLSSITNGVDCTTGQTINNYWQVSDCCSNTSTCSQTITVSAQTVVVVPAGTPSVTLTWPTNLVLTWPNVNVQWTHYGTNIVGATNVALNITNIAPANAGPYGVIVSGSGYLVFNQHLIFSGQLTLNCHPDKTVFCGSLWSFDPPDVFNGTCTNPAVTMSFTTTTNPGCPQQITRAWLATDKCGHSSTCSQTVTIRTTPPIIYAPTEVVAYGCSNGVPVFFDVTASNSCTVGAPNTCPTCPKALVVCFPPSGSLFGMGTNTVTCIAWDLCGATNTTTFQVVVLPDPNCCQPPVVATQPQTIVTSASGTAVLQASATGTPALSYQWLKDGIVLVDAGEISGSQTPTLTINPAQAFDAGGYSVAVTNSCGVATSLVAQVVISSDYLPDGAVTLSASNAVIIGTNATYTFTISNEGALPLDGLTLSGTFTGLPATLIAATPGCSVTPSGNDFNLTCPLPSLPLGTTVVYTVTFQVNQEGTLAFNGSLSTAPAEVIVNNNAASAAIAFGYPPAIVSDPIGFSSTPGSSGILNVSATGTAPLDIYWRLDNVPTGPVSDTFSFPELHSSDEGSYVAIASNAWGTAVSAPAVVTLSFPGYVTAGIDGSQVLQVLGKTAATDMEIRLKAGDPSQLVVEDKDVSVVGEFSINNFNKVVINLGDGDNKLIVNDVNGVVTDLNMQFEIHGGTGSNLVVASSQGIDLNALPGLISTLQAAPDFEALTTNFYNQCYASFVTPALDMANRLYTNLVLTSQMLKQMANTNLFVQASNRIAQAQLLGDLAKAYANEGAYRFSNAGYSVQQFTNCLFGLIAQLEAREDAVAGLEGDDEDDDTVYMDGLSEQMDGLIDDFEDGADQYQDALEASGNDFENRATQNVQAPGEQLGNTDGPNFEALAGAFSDLASQLLEAQAAQAELDADAFSAQAVAFESAADDIVAQASLLNQAIENFTALADPLGVEPLVSIPTGTNAGCDKNIDANHQVFINIGGIIIGTKHNDKIVAKPNTFLILGLAGDDLIIGSDGFNIIHGGSGDDEIHGQGGTDLLFGGKGNDCIFGDAGFDLVFGGDGDDNLHGGTNIDLIIGGKGNDKMYGDENFDLMIGGEGNDTMDGGDGINIMFGNSGNDTMTGGNGYTLTNEIPFLCKITIGSLMFGGDGNDTMYGGDGIDIMFGGNGNDTMYSSNNIDFVFGNAGSDIIYGGDGGPLFYVVIDGVKTGFRLGNLLFGGSGNDQITGGRDIDLMFGGDGNDTIRGSYSYPFWKGSFFKPTCGDVDFAADDDLIFGGSGNDDLDGGYGTDFIFGGPGDDLIKGNGEPFRLLFTPEIDFLFGGKGNDTIIGGPWDTITLAFGNDNNDDITGSKFGVMNLLFGNDGNDTIKNNGDLFSLSFCGSGTDTNIGGALLLDLMFGGPDDDNMQGGSFGALDVMFGGDGDDIMTGNGSLIEVQFGNNGNDTMDSGLCLLYAMFGNDGCDNMKGNGLLGVMFGNDGADTMTGGFGIDIMFGGPGPDIMDGGDGPDIMFGGAGNDTMYGGTDSWPNVMLGNDGDDIIHGGNGPDVLLGNAGDDHIYGEGGPDIIFGGLGHDAIDGGDGPDLIFGGKDDDCLVGGNGNDLIFGGKGNDWIDGGPDGDLIFGNRGNDTILSGGGLNFVFGNKDDDTIKSTGDSDRVWGNSGNDNIQNYSDGARLRGNGGDDQFDLQAGSARVFGGKGTDYYGLNGGSVSKVKSASSGTVSVSIPNSYCAEVHGIVWLDSNHNGVRDNNEPLVAGVKVYLDLNNDGIWESNEPYTYTTGDDPETCFDDTGMYSLTDLPAGTYHVREVPPAGYYQDFPIPSYNLTLGAIDVLTGKDLGHTAGRLTPAIATATVTKVGANVLVTLRGSGGYPDTGYNILSTTNLAIPFQSWTVVGAHLFDGSGNFATTNSFPATEPQRFFILTAPNGNP